MMALYHWVYVFYIGHIVSTVEPTAQLAGVTVTHHLVGCDTKLLNDDRLRKMFLAYTASLGKIDCAEPCLRPSEKQHGLSDVQISMSISVMWWP